MGPPTCALTTSHAGRSGSNLADMAGTIVIVVILVIAPVIICMSGALVAAVLGLFLKSERDAAFEGTEQLDLANRS